MRLPARVIVLAAFFVWLSSVAASGTWAQATPAQDTSWTLDQPLTGHATPCEGGWIKIFDCQNVELLSYLPPSAIGGTGFYDIWGWTDSTRGREFVMTSGEAGTAFVEVTDPVNPTYLGMLPLHGTAPFELLPGLAVGPRAPGIKVYKNHAFITAEGTSDQGVQVFDLTQLRDVRTPKVFQETAHYDNLGNAHTLVANEAAGFIYPVGSRTEKGKSCGGGLHMIDVRTPAQPTFMGCYTDAGWIHDAQCVVYHGPDKAYQGRELCLTAVPGKGIDIVDVTDKQAVKAISTGTYPDLGYTHQGWLTEDQRHFFVDDEEDPRDKTRTIVFDLDDLDDPVVQTVFYGTTTATAHNLYIRGRYMYQSNYAAGLRIVDVGDPKNPKEVGYLDTAPTSDNPGQQLGSWGNYPFFQKDVVAVASQGLFLVRLRPR